jgi:hypothetical protein
MASIAVMSANFAVVDSDEVCTHSIIILHLCFLGGQTREEEEEDRSC